jgi:hypothetical protein
MRCSVKILEDLQRSPPLEFRSARWHSGKVNTLPGVCQTGIVDHAGKGDIRVISEVAESDYAVVPFLVATVSP